MADQIQLLSYSTPNSWSSTKFPKDFKIQTIKNGVLIEEKRIDSLNYSSKTPVASTTTSSEIANPNVSYLVMGRLPVCDIESEHPSVSRYHCILQSGTTQINVGKDGQNVASEGIHDRDYTERMNREDEIIQVYVYDLGSVHGTFVNKKRIEPKKFIQLKNGGQSKRMYFIQGLKGSKDNESPKPFSSIIPSKSNKPGQEESTVSWGFKEDNYDENEKLEDGQHLENGTIGSENDLEASLQNKSYFKDPKKYLKQFLDENDCKAPLYKFDFRKLDDGENTGAYLCKITTDYEIDDQGQCLQVIGESLKNKKEAEREAALKTCYELDKLGLLREEDDNVRKAELKRLKELMGDDDDDHNDEFYDRTKKKRSSGTYKGMDQKAETYESLMEKKKSLWIEMQDLEYQLTNSKSINNQSQNKTNEGDEEDELDAFMNKVQTSINTEADQAIERSLKDLKKELDKVESLLKIVGKPSSSSLMVKSASQSNTPASPNIPVYQKSIGSPKSPMKSTIIDITIIPENNTSIEDNRENSSSSLKTVPNATIKSPTSPFKAPPPPGSFQQLQMQQQARASMAPMTREQYEQQQNSQKQFSLFKESEEDVVDCTKNFGKKL